MCGAGRARYGLRERSAGLAVRASQDHSGIRADDEMRYVLRPDVSRQAADVRDSMPQPGIGLPAAGGNRGEARKTVQCFPLWKSDTKWLINDFISKGFRTITCCVNDEYLNEEWVGREIDSAFVSQLPAAVDPCGENGEFHTFCYEGPLFKKKIRYRTVEKVYKPKVVKTDHGFNTSFNTKGLGLCDLIPGYNIPVIP